MFAASSFVEAWTGEVDGETWTSDSLINPFEFPKWKQLGIEPCRSGAKHFHAVIENYDPKHPVQKVGLVLLPIGGEMVIIHGFTYEYENFVWVYQAFPEEKMFRRIQKVPSKKFDPPAKTPPAAPKNPRIIPNTNSDGMS
jgi:hypothetical protein